MSYYDEKENVEEYRRLSEGFDGSFLINKLESYLKKGSTVLELGSGLGKDINLLQKSYDVTGSDSSMVFIENYNNNNNGNKKMIHLDAVTINTKEKFDCIYSNKVLHHLETNMMLKSIERQTEIIDGKGICFHSFWRGNGNEVLDHLFFQYYEIEKLEDIFNRFFKNIEIA